ncbi:hypothetical protein LZZ85_10110 [Terrimonas sp. NA20]|uniref:Uncharacterized protein n=1 Tax=Terrimonas ginsenosidimutans TaxID=2908004 RepID=A0ABS9KQR0_9BACT|nr:hypothetical protein [Terrimonas ginsenosidimutans]MCG2614638.1 hypothetical protein [Terrimonas ginsenosidimutans]
MKETKHSYISAYPLKVMEQAVAGEPGTRNDQAAYLKELLDSRAKSISRIRVSPMADPYKAPVNDSLIRTSIPS